MSFSIFDKFQFLFSFFLLAQKQVRPQLEISSMQNITVQLGQNASLSCYATGGTLPKFGWLKWKVSGINQSVLERIYTWKMVNISPYAHEFQLTQKNMVTKPWIRTSVLHGVKINLTNVTKRDEGLYTCFASNTLGYDARTIYLTVRSKSFFKSLIYSVAVFRLVI